jgi:hypothetical protein
VKNGNVASFAFGFTRKFLRDLEKDHEGQRALSSCYGQSGTAGNINRSLIEIFFRGIDDGCMVLFLLQVHDSLFFMVHKDKIHSTIPVIREIMERATEIHGRKVVIPTDCKVGITWSKHMLSYKPELTYEDILAFEEEKFGKKYPKEEIIEPIVLPDNLLEDFQSEEDEELGEFEHQEDRSEESELELA